MAEMYMRHIRDWREATLMLSFEEKGYYDEILNLIYIYDDCLADNDDLICRAMPVHKKTHFRLKQRLIDEGLISIKRGFYHNKRASEEIEKINLISEKNKIKAQNRWAKSRAEKEKPTAAADKQVKHEKNKGTASELLKEKSESERESDSEKENERKKVKSVTHKAGAKGKSSISRNSYAKRNTQRKSTNKCPIEDILDPDGKVPEEYRRFAEEAGLSNIQRCFNDWAGWWVSEDGRKAGARGWLQTWKARVRKDVDRQNAKGQDRNRHQRGGGCSTTDGARLALSRRRNRQSKI